jgi:hypothetical protein
VLAVLLLESEQADALLSVSPHSRIYAARHVQGTASAAAAGREDVTVTAEPSVPRRESMSTIVEELNRLRAQETRAGSAATTIDSNIAAFLDAPADIPLPKMPKQSAEPATAAAGGAAPPAEDTAVATATATAAPVQPTAATVAVQLTAAASVTDHTISGTSSSSSSSSSGTDSEAVTSAAAPSPTAAAVPAAANNVPAPFAHQPWLSDQDRRRTRKGPNVAHARAQRLIVLELKQLR